MLAYSHIFANFPLEPKLLSQLHLLRQTELLGPARLLHMAAHKLRRSTLTIRKIGIPRGSRPSSSLASFGRSDVSMASACANPSMHALLLISCPWQLVLLTLNDNLFVERVGSEISFLPPTHVHRVQRQAHETLSSWSTPLCPVPRVWIITANGLQRTT